MPRWLAFDIGGANLKAAHEDGSIRSVVFDLWRFPERLAEALVDLAATLPPADAWAVTMTGELCDCFRTRSDGVRSILASVESAAGDRSVRVWGTDGAFHDPAAIRDQPLLAAASNWVALATVLARGGFGRSGLLIDIGSTTTDFIPWHSGELLIPPDRRTDLHRLRDRTLVYVGVRRTTLARGTAVYRDCNQWPLMGETFATHADIYVTLGKIPEDPDDRSTANGQPLTMDHSRDRLARMLGLDCDDFTPEDAHIFARNWHADLVQRLSHDLSLMMADLCGQKKLDVVILAGSGEFLAEQVASDQWGGQPFLSLSELWGPEASAAACAVALLHLIRDDGRNPLVNPITVVKLGGSLLEWPEWPNRLQTFLESMPNRRVVLVIGGGRSVDVIRDLDRIHALGSERAHHLALEALQTSARVASTLLPGSTLIADLDDLPGAWRAGALPILDIPPILATVEAMSGPLPHTWDVTSDSIAARVATHLGAAELVLLKSTPLPADCPDWTAAATLGLVDPEFPRIAAPIPSVRFVSLRAN